MSNFLNVAPSLTVLRAKVLSSNMVYTKDASQAILTFSICYKAGKPEKLSDGSWKKLPEAWLNFKMFVGAEKADFWYGLLSKGAEVSIANAQLGIEEWVDKVSGEKKQKIVYVVPYGGITANFREEEKVADDDFDSID